MIYVLVLFPVYIAIYFSFIRSGVSKGIVLLVTLPFVPLAFLRGNVGTDTTIYQGAFNNLDLDYFYFEPFFSLLAVILLEVFESDLMAVRGVSLVFFGFSFIYIFRANRNEIFLLLAYLIPAFFFVYSLNTLRLGVAVIILLLFFQQYRMSKFKKINLIYFIAPVLFHYSTLIVYLIKALFDLKFSFRLISSFLSILLLFFGLIFYFEDYFLVRLYAYLEFSSPSVYSGISKVIVLFFLINGVFFAPIDNKIRFYLYFCFLTVFFYSIAIFSYAGLRLLDLLTIVIPLIYYHAYSCRGLDFNFNFKLVLALSGFLSALGVIRNFWTTAGIGDSPFLPYTTFF